MNMPSRVLEQNASPAAPRPVSFTVEFASWTVPYLPQSYNGSVGGIASLYTCLKTRDLGDQRTLEEAWSDLVVKIQGTWVVNRCNESDSCSDHCKIRILTVPPSCFVLNKIVAIQCIYSNRFGL